MSFENGDRSKKQPSDNEGQSAQLAAGREKYDDKCSSSRFDNAIRVLPSVSGNNNGGAIPLSINVPMEAKVSVAHATTDNLGHAEKITGISTHARGAVFEGGAPPGDDTDKMKLQGQVVATSKSRSYRDYSQVANADPFRPLLAPNKHLTFPLKMHIMLSHTEFEDIVSWLPHGRAWRILKTKAFSEKVLPLLFRECKYSSFIRQVNGWGFQRLTQGVDRNSYFHELFLRGLPHLTKHMNRPSLSEKVKFDPDDEPDFYKISETYSLPPNLPEQSFAGSPGATGAAVSEYPNSHDVQAAVSLGPITGEAEDRKVSTYGLTNGAISGLAQTTNAGLDARTNVNISGLQGLNNTTQALQNLHSLSNDALGLRSIGGEQPARLPTIVDGYGSLPGQGMMIHGLQGNIGGIDAHDPQAIFLQRALLQEQLLQQARIERSQLERAVLLNFALGGDGGCSTGVANMNAPSAVAAGGFAGLGGAVGRGNPDLSSLNPGLLQALQQHQLIQQARSVNMGGLLGGALRPDNSFPVNTLADLNRQQQIQQQIQGLSTQGLLSAGGGFDRRSFLGGQLPQTNQLQGSVLPNIGGAANGNQIQGGTNGLRQDAASNPYLSLHSLQQYPSQQGNNKPPL